MAKQKSKVVKHSFISIEEAKETCSKIADEFHTLEAELLNLEGGKKVSATRARRAANEMKKLCLQIRKEITEVVNNM